jgi:cytochrome c-type biogenesis protein CcmH/NrfG
VLLGVGLALQRDYRRAFELVQKATRLEPDNALIWLLAADFFSRGPAKAQAIEAARKALALDPDLVRAQELLKSLEGAESREGR